MDSEHKFEKSDQVVFLGINTPIQKVKLLLGLDLANNCNILIYQFLNHLIFGSNKYKLKSRLKSLLEFVNVYFFISAW